MFILALFFCKKTEVSALAITSFALLGEPPFLCCLLFVGVVGAVLFSGSIEAPPWPAR